MSSKHRLLRPSCISLRLAREKSSRDGERWSKRGIIVATTKSRCRRATAGIASQWFKISLQSYVERSINAANHGFVFIQKYNALFIYNNTTYTKYKISANNGFFQFWARYTTTHILWLLWWMLEGLGGTCAAGRLDADHLSIPAWCSRTRARRWDRRCAGRGAGWSLRWGTGHVLRGKCNILPI